MLNTHVYKVSTYFWYKCGPLSIYCVKLVNKYNYFTYFKILEPIWNEIS